MTLAQTAAQREAEDGYRQILAEKDALIASQAARIRELEEGLEPFAKAGGVKLCGEWRDDERFGHTDVTFYLTFGDLRRARSLLSRKGGE